VLGLALEVVLIHYEDQVISTLGDFFSSRIEHSAAFDQDRIYLQKIVDSLSRHQEKATGPFTVSVVENDAVNALAYPGGNIVVHSALLNKVQSENELAMVLSHELGHFAHKDHLKGLGRGLVLLVFSVALLGQDSQAASLVGGAIEAMHGKYSREQELQADEFGLDLLQKEYGHVGGSLDFFERLAKHENSVLFQAFATSHPLSRQRVQRLKELIVERDYTLEMPLPLRRDNTHNPFLATIPPP
jgi:predicted Zn-dependent protease